MTGITRRVLLSGMVLLPATARAQTPAPADAYLYFISPRDGERITGAFWCRFGLRNMGVAPAGVKKENTGHHHLLIDVDGPVDPNEPIPADRKHVHFGGGQTEARIELPPGRHTLQLVMGDEEHRLHNPPVMSKKITITVR